MTHLARFTALLCDERYDASMKAMCGTECIGFRVTIEYETNEELTIDYLTKMAIKICELPVIDHKYFVNVKPVWSCCCEK